MQEVIDRVKECMDILNREYFTNIAYPAVIMNNRLRTTAGRANGIQVEFATVLYEGNKKDFHENTIPHEVAHYFVIRYYDPNKPKPHGKEWKTAMRFLGARADVYHNMSVQKNTTKYHIYTCGCNNVVHDVATVTHNRIQRGERSYRCKACKVEIKLKGA